MKPNNAIEVTDVTKSFKVYFDKGNTMKEKVLFQKRRRYEERRVLDGICFEVKKGEAIGLIGHNGCGKSTTLKLLTKIMYPDKGKIEMRGRVSSLIELGAGFHPDMSGRENIYINASIFGLSRKEIDARLDDIIEFSELEEYIDNPVRTYSSGMYMRLAFSVAINVNADILLIDEILAVGDVNFQAKCFNRLREIKGKGTTIVIVSHSLEQIEQICDRSIWIHEGHIYAEGNPKDIHPQYIRFMAKNRHLAPAALEKLHSEEEENENYHVVISQIEIYSRGEKSNGVIFVGTDIEITAKYETDLPVEDVTLGFSFYRGDGLCCYGTNSKTDHARTMRMTKNGKIKLMFPKVNMLPGEYWMDLYVEDRTGVRIVSVVKACHIQIYADVTETGITRMEHSWNCIEGE